MRRRKKFNSFLWKCNSKRELIVIQHNTISTQFLFYQHMNHFHSFIHEYILLYLSLLISTLCKRIYRRRKIVVKDTCLDENVQLHNSMNMYPICWWKRKLEKFVLMANKTIFLETFFLLEIYFLINISIHSLYSTQNTWKSHTKKTD